MTDRKSLTLARMLQVVQSLEDELGVGALHRAEATLLASIADLSVGDEVVQLGDIFNHSKVKNMPQVTVYKGLRALRDKGLLVKVGGEKSGNYKLA